MDEKLKAVLDKIAKLRALAANAGTQAEAEAAAAQAAALVAKYQIDEAQVEVSDPTRAERVEVADEPLFRSDKRNEKWRSMLAGGLAQAHGCWVVYTSVIGFCRYRIAGRPSDVAIVRYLFAWLSIEIARLAERERGFAAKTSFRLGAVHGVLTAMERATAAERAAVRTGASVALTVVDNSALARAALVGRAGADVGIRKGKVPAISDKGALRRGYVAGTAIAPKQALTAGDGTLLLGTGK